MGQQALRHSPECQFSKVSRKNPPAYTRNDIIPSAWRLSADLYLVLENPVLWAGSEFFGYALTTLLLNLHLRLESCGQQRSLKE